MLKNKSIIGIALIAWLIITMAYHAHTPLGNRTYDFQGHLTYTKIIANEHRFPRPHDGWETFHPPLYYLVNSYLAPHPKEEDPKKHVFYVQALSVLYGAIVLIVIEWFLRKLKIDSVLRLITLLFILTTPGFLITFSTYNNDSLANVLCVGIVALSYKLFENWTNRNALFLLVISTASLYTKYTSLFCIGAVIVVCLRNIIKLKKPSLIDIRIVIILLSSVLLLYPWLEFHNKKYSGKLLPHNIESGWGNDLAINDDRATSKVVFKIPFYPTNPHEWDDPWAHGYARLETKKHDFWAFSFITSVFSEFTYNFEEMQIIWLIFWIHLIGNIFAILQVGRSNISKIAFVVLLLAQFGQIATLFYVPKPGGCAMDFRYICWTWLSWSVLYSYVISQKNILSRLLLRMMIVGIILHTYVLLTMSGHIT